MGLFSKIVIAAGIGLVNKIIDNKNEKERQKTKLKQEEIRLKSEIEQLKLQENAKRIEMQRDYDMEKLEANNLYLPSNISNTIQCKNCKKTISKTATFCGYCGAEIKTQMYCKKCGNELLEDALFCGYCGEKVK